MRILDIVGIDATIRHTSSARRQMHEMLPPDPLTNQMEPPKDPEQLTQAATIKPTGEIDDAAARVSVHELFNRQAPVRQIGQLTYTFSVDDKAFIMDFAPTGTPGAMEAVLSRQNVGDYKNPFDTLNDFGKNPVIVYSTAIAIIKRYLEDYKPGAVFFYGFDPHQKRAYAKMAYYKIQQLPDYELHTKEGTVAFIRKRLQENDAELSRDEINRIEHDKMAKDKPDMRRSKFVSMPGNTSTYPAL